MGALVLHVSSKVKLSRGEVEDWKRALGAVHALGKVHSEAAGPFEIVVALAGSPEPEPVVGAVVAAFLELGVDSGKIDVALSEHDASDSDLEAPAFFEREVDLANPAGTPIGTTVSIDITAALGSDDDVRGTPFTDAQLAALGDVLRARLPGPLVYFGLVSPGLRKDSIASYILEPQPAESVPTAEAIEAAVRAAVAAANIEPLQIEFGAYVGDWDHTVFQKIIE